MNVNAVIHTQFPTRGPLLVKHYAVQPPLSRRNVINVKVLT